MTLRSARGRLLAIGASSTVRTLAWVALAGATALLVRAEASRPEEPEGVRAFTDLVYREVGGSRLRLDVYVPDVGSPSPSARKRPALLAIHGGGWRGGGKAITAGRSPRW